MSKTTTHSIREKGVAVRLYRRGSSPIWTASFRVDGQKIQRSTEEEGLDSAKGAARKMVADELADALTARPGEDLTLGELFAAYRRHHLPSLTAARQREARSRMTMFSEAWGSDLRVVDVDASRLRSYVRQRRDLKIVSPGLRLDENGDRRRGYREPQPPRDGALDAEFRWLNSVFNFAVDHRVDGQPLLDRNPLPRGSKKRRAIGWPKEKNPRRPVASHKRFVATMAKVDEIDGTGALGCILALARYTGRRETSIVSLRASDLLLNEARMREALAEAGMKEDLADAMPFGAIRWAAETDKQGVLTITPISQEARAALDRYLRRTPRVGALPLFPAPKDASKPISRYTAAKRLLRAEKLAGQTKLAGGVFHPYRRAWAIERRHLPKHDVAAAGGWTDTQALTLIYQKATPDGVLAAVLGRDTA